MQSAVSVGLVDQKLVLSLERQVHPKTSGVKVQIAWTERQSVTEGQCDLLTKMSSRVAKRCQHAGKQLSSGCRPSCRHVRNASSNQEHHAATRAHSNLMWEDPKIKIRLLGEHIGESAAFGQLHYAQTGWTVMGEQKLCARRVDRQVDRASPELYRRAQHRRMARPLVELHCTNPLPARVSTGRHIATADVEDAKMRMR